MDFFYLSGQLTQQLREINQMYDPDAIRTEIRSCAQYLAKFYKLLRTANLSNYDRRRLHTDFLKLYQFLSVTKQQKLPRAYFSFSSRKYLPLQKAEEAEIQPEIVATDRDILGLQNIQLQIKTLINSIQDCDGCTFLLPPLQQLFVFRCRNCHFIGLETSAACFLEFLENCTVSGSAHQLRFSNCIDCSISVAVNGPIIERCRNMKFTRPDYECVGWDQVVDFSWLRTDIESGNFQVTTGE